MIDILILNNKRLDFKNSKNFVNAFLKKRLKYFGLNNFKFINNENLHERIQESLKKSDYIFIWDVMNPFIDFELIKSVIKYSNHYKLNFLKPIGHVGGTGFDIFINNFNQKFENGLNINDISFEFFEFDTQRKYNNQLNLYKYKRLKLFIKLVEKNENLFKSNIVEIFNYLDKKNVYEYLNGFAEKIKLEYYKKCPHCSGELHKLFNSQSQPMVGYVSSKYPHYSECKNCKLVLSTPRISPNDVHKIYDEWDKQDFVKSLNNPYNEKSRRCNFSNLGINTNESIKILDLGGGEGNFSKYLFDKYKNWEIYHSDYSLKLNIHPEIKSFELDFTNQNIEVNDFDIITAWEVIEHVPYEKLEFMFNNIYKALKTGGVFIFSTPNYDSPLIKILDFYSVAMPFHYTILSEKWLDKYIPENTKFKIIKKDHTSDFLDDHKNWLNYAIKSSKNLKEACYYKVLYEILDFDHVKVKNHMLDKGIGTEIIYFIKKT